MGGGSGGLVVSRIGAGTVIDHIPAGQALRVLSILGITGGEGRIVALVMNVPSTRMGRKDIVKVEGVELSPVQVNRIALVAPGATINLIRDYRVVSKSKVELPDELVGVVSCGNPNCVTNAPGEPIVTRFRVISRDPPRLACEYCGYEMDAEEAASRLTPGG